MRQACDVVESGFRMCLYRARSQARLRLASIAEVDWIGRLSEFEFDIEQERATIGMPEPELRMHQDPER